MLVFVLTITIAARGDEAYVKMQVLLFVAALHGCAHAREHRRASIRFGLKKVDGNELVGV